MSRVIRAELFKLRTTSAWWVFGLATLLSTGVMLAVDCVDAHLLLLPFDQYVTLSTHGHGTNVPADFLAHLQEEWSAGHDAVAQAATIYTAGQLIGVLLACLLGIVLITGEYHHQTATSTFTITPRRATVVRGKLVTAVTLAGASWLLSTVVSVVVGAVFLHSQGSAPSWATGVSSARSCSTWRPTPSGRCSASGSERSSATSWGRPSPRPCCTWPGRRPPAACSNC
jgi:ABC-2 type transport system permease protein